ncbi:MAG: hypothetical protein ACI87E_000777 [Mariniblastus sp.]|jgi:hypothetical protein
MLKPQTFHHQNYANVPDPSSYQQVFPGDLKLPGSELFSQSLERASIHFRKSGVSRIILVHGTIAGTDALGWLSHWARVMPEVARSLKRLHKSVVDSLTGDRGNYSKAFAEVLADSLNQLDHPTAIQVERFEWTSENHHLGRANAAVRLAHRLLDCEANGESVLLWGHSHAGNAFALATQLLGTSRNRNPELLKTFFDATLHFNRSTQRIDLEAWERLSARLAECNHQRPMLQNLKIVTFGTPIRYGWDATAYSGLLHFVNHHPFTAGGTPPPPYRSVWPNSPRQFREALTGGYGDFVQQTFIACSDLPPAVWSWDAWKANRLLKRCVEATERQSKHLWRLKQALRVADQGKTLLVDYAQVDPSATAFCGHAVYTQIDWMAFHLDQIVAEL